MSTTDIFFTLMVDLKSFVSPGFWMTVGEDSFQYKKREKSTAS